MVSNIFSNTNILYIFICFQVINYNHPLQTIINSSNYSYNKELTHSYMISSISI